MILKLHRFLRLVHQLPCGVHFQFVQLAETYVRDAVVQKIHLQV